MAKKFTKTALKEIKSNSGNGIVAKVIDDIFQRWDYDGEEVAKSYVRDVLVHGCDSGIVYDLIYCIDTTAFFEMHKKEIIERVKELMTDCGFHSPAELFGDNWDEDDFFCEEECNQQLLAWFGYEEAMRDIAREFDELEDYA